MGLFDHHSKTSDEPTTDAGTHTSEFTATDTDLETLNPPTAHQSQSSTTAPAQRNAPQSDGLEHETCTEKEKKHHFWNKLSKSDVGLVSIDHEGHAGILPIGKPLNDGKLHTTAAKLQNTSGTSGSIG
jgi:hypothetical protein